MALVIPSRSYSAVASADITFYSAQFPMSGLNLLFGTVVPNVIGTHFPRIMHAFDLDWCWVN